MLWYYFLAQSLWPTPHTYCRHCRSWFPPVFRRKQTQTLASKKQHTNKADLMNGHVFSACCWVAYGKHGFSIVHCIIKLHVKSLVNLCVYRRRQLLCLPVHLYPFNLCTVYSMRLLEVSLVVPGIGTKLKALNDGQSLMFRPWILRMPKEWDIQLVSTWNKKSGICKFGFSINAPHYGELYCGLKAREQLDPPWALLSD